MFYTLDTQKPFYDIDSYCQSKIAYVVLSTLLLQIGRSTVWSDLLDVSY